MLRLRNTKKPFSKLNSKLVTVIAIENENLNLFHPTSFDNAQHTFEMFISTLCFSLQNLCSLCTKKSVIAFCLLALVTEMSYSFENAFTLARISSSTSAS